MNHQEVPHSLERKREMGDITGSEAEHERVLPPTWRPRQGWQRGREPLSQTGSGATSPLMCAQLLLTFGTGHVQIMHRPLLRVSLTKVKAKGSQSPLPPPGRTQHEMAMLFSGGDDQADGQQRLKFRVFQPRVFPLEGDWRGENRLHF